MPEISFYELILIAIVGVLVIGPERLPETLRTLGLWFGRMRRSFNAVKTEIEKEIGMDEVKRQLHNEAIMEEMKRIEAEVKNTANVATNNVAANKVATNKVATDKESGSPAATATQTELPGMNPAGDPGADGEISDLIAAQDGGVPANRIGTESRPVDDRDHSDAGAGEADDRDHTDAGAESGSKQPPHRVTSG